MSKMRLPLLLAAWIAVAGLLVFALGDQSTEAHPTIHPQKKLFGHRWYKQFTGMGLTTSPPWFLCDGGTPSAPSPSCTAKWSVPAYLALIDWNSQPMKPRFQVQGNQNENYDVNIYVVETLFNNAFILGVGLPLDGAKNICEPGFCSTVRYGEVGLSDYAHGENPQLIPYGTPDARKVTTIHELGHLLNLAHESTNESGPPPYPRYQCGFDNTGPIPVSAMAYDCIDPPQVGGSGITNVQDFDVCGVNHAYTDATFEWEGCVCYPPPGGGPAPVGPLAYYHPVTPARVLDTRLGTGRLGYGCQIEVQITGVWPVPASGVSAVVLNATITNPSRGSFLTVYPSNAGLPGASNLNFTPGQTVPNLITVKVGANGRVKIYNAAGQTHVIFDVVGWYGDTPDGPPGLPTPTPTPEPAGYGYYHPLPPSRILDTRSGPCPCGKLGPNGTTDVVVTNVGGVPPHVLGVTAVVLNVTVTDPSAGSFLTVYPTGVPRPNASNLNFGPGQTVPNLVIVKVGDLGKVTAYNCCGFTHVIFDVVGWYGGIAGDSSLFHSLSPSRIMDTRVGFGWPGKLGFGVANVDVTNTFGSGVPDGAKAIVVNATVTQPTAAGYITVYPSDVGWPPPTASNLNFAPGQTVPNLVMVRVPPNGIVNVYNVAGQTHVILDVVGYFD
jgi:hypothetical protein